MRWTGILLLLLNWTVVGNGQRFHLSHYRDQSTLERAEVRHFTWDTTGFAWLATDRGLLRFDGNTFESYNHDVSSKYGRFLTTTADGLLYAHDAGITHISSDHNGVNTRIFQEAATEEDQEGLRYPHQLFYHAGEFWVAQPRGRIGRIREGAIKTYFLGENAATGQSDSGFHFFARGEQLWAVSSAGQLLGYHPKRDTFLTAYEGREVNAILYAPPFLWLGGKELTRLEVPDVPGEKASSTVKRIKLESDVTAMTADSSGNLYLGLADKGLYYATADAPDKLALRPVFSNNDPHRVDRLPFRWIHYLEWRTPAELWVGSAEGLGILRRRFFESVTGLPNGNVTALRTTPDGRAFVNFGDLFRIEAGEEGTLRGENIPLSATLNSVAAVEENLIVGTSDGKLITLSPTGRQLKINDLSERGEGIFYLFDDPAGAGIWFCQAPADRPLKGVARLSTDGRTENFGAEAGLENRILVVKADTRKRVYAAGIGISTYLYRFVPEENRFLNLSHPFDFPVDPNFEVHDFTIDDTGLIWLATTDGLLLHDVDRIQRVALPELPEDVEIRAVAARGDRGVWLATDTEGIVFYDGKKALPMEEESGLPSKIMSYRALEFDAQGRLWAGTAEGLVYSSNVEPTPLPTPPPLLSVAQDSAWKIFEEDSVVTRLLLPSFHGHDVYYQYRVNSEWRAAPDGTVKLLALSPGTYDLAFRARREGAYTWSQSVTRRLEVSRRWYRQAFWQWTTVGLVFALGGLAFLLKRRKYKTRIAELDAEIDRLQNQPHGR